MKLFLDTNVVLDYLAKRQPFAEDAQSEIDRLWDTGELDEVKVESFRHLHERTPYRK